MRGPLKIGDWIQYTNQTIESETCIFGKVDSIDSYSGMVRVGFYAYNDNKHFWSCPITDVEKLTEDEAMLRILEI